MYNNTHEDTILLHGCNILPCPVYNSFYGSSLFGRLDNCKSCVVPYSEDNSNVCVRVWLVLSLSPVSTTPFISVLKEALLHWWLYA